MKTSMVAPLLLSAAAFTVAIAAFLLALDDRGGDDGGRVVTTGPLSGYEVEKPVLFERDEFFLVRHPDLDGGLVSFSALYRVVPHIYFGVEKGCQVRWEPDTSFDANGTTYAGIFDDPCSGSKFTVDGKRLFGPASRDLDQFLAIQVPGTDNATIDTRVLLCSNSAQPCMRTLAER